MTPKEKAEEIIYNMTDASVKQCALICIEEMILISDDSKEQKYLEEVKQEINNLK